MKEKVKNYIKSNILFLLFILIGLLNSTILRVFTVGDIFNIKPIFGDLIVLLILGAFSYFVDNKNKTKYFVVLLIITSLICIVNSIYYGFYSSYASISLIKTLSQLEEIKDVIFNNIDSLKHFIYLILPIAYITTYKLYFKKIYFKENKQISKDRKYALNTILTGLLVSLIFLITLTNLEMSRFYKQWNREYIVLKFGIYTYQINDIVRSLEPELTGVFGEDNAMKEFSDFYSRKEEHNKNEYTNIFKDKNIITIHVENIQSFVLDLEFNGEKVTPNLNKLKNSGLYFSNFYTQENIGSSSDTEFTLNTGLLPAETGTVFVSYWDREFITIPNLLKERGYYSFSMHGNVGDFWNRRVMHHQMGYDRFYSKKDYEIDEVIGLGLSDESFLMQSVEKIKAEIEAGNTPFYATTITLSNHTPFTATSEEVDFDVDIKVEVMNDYGETEIVSMPYLEELKIGDYIKSVHYTDYAIGKYLEKLDDAGILDNSVIMIYGDKDASLAKSDYEILYNYDAETGELLNETDINYKSVDYYTYELNKKVPLIIYNKSKKINKEIDTVMGTYDILPTLGNMFGFSSPYSLGHDIFNMNDNTVVFPNGNFLTNKVYYNDQKEEYLVLTEEPLEEDYIIKNTKYTNEILKTSNNIITYDLIKKEQENKEILKEIGK